VIAIALLATNVVFANNREAEPFASIWEAITSIQTQIDNLALVAGPQGPQGPAGEITPGFLPPPAFDSGWIELSQGTVIDVPHNVGGDYNDYFIYATYRRPAENGTLKSHQTAADVVWWEDVTANNIQIVTNGNVSNNFDAARIRIWKIQ
jgi:hypothetical protein